MTEQHKNQYKHIYELKKELAGIEERIALRGWDRLKNDDRLRFYELKKELINK